MTAVKNSRQDKTLARAAYIVGALTLEGLIIFTPHDGYVGMYEETIKRLAYLLDTTGPESVAAAVATATATAAQPGDFPGWLTNPMEGIEVKAATGK